MECVSCCEADGQRARVSFWLARRRLRRHPPRSERFSYFCAAQLDRAQVRGWISSWLLCSTLERWNPLRSSLATRWQEHSIRIWVTASLAGNLRSES